tara:strand:- start:3157 stop:3756 length:600 start_codon:yes stop_codon:yes gene_type:complete
MLGYVSHPLTDNVLLPLIRKSYQNIGLEVSFMAVEAERGLRLLEDGMVDGDVVRTTLVLDNLNGVIKVAKLGEFTVELHCRPGIRCQLDDLTNPGVLIFFPESARAVKTLELQITAKKYHVRDWSQLVQLYHAGKVDRFLWVSSTLNCVHPATNTSVVALPVAPIDIYHVIHQSNAALAAPLKHEIENELAVINAEGCR